VFKIKYIGAMDILSRVGGLSASILPIMRILGPIIILWFLINLSSIIRYHLKNEYFNNILSFTKLSKEKLEKALELESDGAINISEYAIKESSMQLIVLNRLLKKDQVYVTELEDAQIRTVQIIFLIRCLSSFKKLGQLANVGKKVIKEARKKDLLSNLA
jgi:hypothetical protein